MSAIKKTKETPKKKTNEDLRKKFKIIKTQNPEVVLKKEQYKKMYDLVWKDRVYTIGMSSKSGDNKKIQIGPEKTVNLSPGSILFSCNGEEREDLETVIKMVMGNRSIKEIFRIGDIYLYFAEFEGMFGSRVCIVGDEEEFDY